MGSRAIECLRRTQYDKPHRSAKAFCPDVSAIPLAVQTNVGILLGIIIAPIERGDLFDLFAESPRVLAGRIAAVPLLSDGDRALKADALNSDEQHFNHYCHIFESLSLAPSLRC
jgi:hypothetical protein